MKRTSVKKKQRFVPSPVDVKADLHRLKVFLRDYKATSVNRIVERYRLILSKARKKKKVDYFHAREYEVAKQIISCDSLDEFFQLDTLTLVW